MTGVFLIVAFIFGAITSPTAILAWPAAILTGIAFGMPMAAWTASRKTEQSFAFVFRFIITPLFLFSGTFFPIEQLPDVLRVDRLVHAALPRRRADARAGHRHDLEIRLCSASTPRT